MRSTRFGFHRLSCTGSLEPGSETLESTDLVLSMEKTKGCVFSPLKPRARQVVAPQFAPEL